MKGLRFASEEEKLPNATSIAALAAAGLLVGAHLYNLWWKVAATMEKNTERNQRKTVREFDEPARPMLPPEKREIRT